MSDSSGNEATKKPHSMNPHESQQMSWPYGKANDDEIFQSNLKDCEDPHNETFGASYRYRNKVRESNGSVYSFANN